MGLFDLLKNAAKGVMSTDTKKGPWQKCPSCGETVSLGMERCPKCGVRIKSMFRRKCPKCQALNELDNGQCSNCKYNFAAELERAKKTYFQCPICGYKSEAYLTSCPVCNTRFS
ncbi:MAG: hypothetical protein Q7S22_01595 [Candidatus Micrarchaeota archaeon]|nr:hypothetical protein [Candidatus Micrarchaeota archaeon]